MKSIKYLAAVGAATLATGANAAIDTSAVDASIAAGQTAAVAVALLSVAAFVAVRVVKWIKAGAA